MTFEPGSKVWIPCRVRRGKFPEERVVYVGDETAGWDGFVDVRHLRDAIDEGETAVVATVVETSDKAICARLPGQVKRRHFLTVPPAAFGRLVSL